MPIQHRLVPTSGFHFAHRWTAAVFKRDADWAEKKTGRRLVSCGIAYDGQIVERVPREATDCSLDYIVTETGILERMDEK